MFKKITALTLSLSFVFLIGCWNYRDLDEMNIVVGIALDYDRMTNQYAMTLEVADLTGSSDESGISGKMIYTKGRTLFEAARNTKRREQDKLFFGSPNVLIIDQELAYKQGIEAVMEWFIRDAECRESICVAISRAETASDILTPPKDTKGLVSERLHDIIREDGEVNSTTCRAQLYQIYNFLNAPRRCAILPAFHRTQDGERVVPEVLGVAVIKGGFLVGFLSPEETKYLLLADNKMKTTILPISVMGRPTADATLEVLENHSKKSFKYENGQLTLIIKTGTIFSLAENQSQLDIMDKNNVKMIEDATKEEIKYNIESLMNTLQKDLKTDVMGFSDHIYKTKPRLWDEIKDYWDELYENAKVEVEVKVKIVNSAFTK